MTPVAAGAAIKGPPPPAPSTNRNAICLPLCDQRGRAAYPFRFVISLGSEPSAFTVQSCRCSLSPALEKTASVLESGGQVGSESVPSPAGGLVTRVAVSFTDVP